MKETGSIRASLQHALDNWKPGQTTLSAPADVILDRSNTGSFGETHAEELQKIETPEHQGISQPVGEGTVGSESKIPVPVPIQESGSASSPPPSSVQTQSASVSSPLAAGPTSPGLNPAVLNNDPAPIPSASSPPPAVKLSELSGSVDDKGKMPAVTPTVAETGIPVSGGPSGPGPSSGSLHEIRSSSSGLSQAASDVAPGPEGSSANRYESAEEEKKRLAREERERFLHGEKPSAGSSDPRDDAPADDGDTPPPYQEL